MEEFVRQLAESDKETSLLNICFEEVNRLRDETVRLRAALSHICGCCNEWNANKLGGVSIQRKRWQRMGQIARAALEG
jgi:hypothetical protein